MFIQEQLSGSSCIEGEVNIPQVAEEIRAFIATRWATSTREVCDFVRIPFTRGNQMAIAWELRAAGFSVRRRILIAAAGTEEWVSFHPEREILARMER